MEHDTIAAISTAMNPSGIGIIRISGLDSFFIAEKIFRPKNTEKKITREPAYTMHYGAIWDGETVLDEVLLLLMRAPHSYTMEDTVEIDCHGGVLVMRRILEAVVKAGARLAEPGEFTKRAFLNGRLDLSQAEAVMDLIEAKNEMALKSSVSQLQGSLRRKISDMREKILYETAYIESALDDPEHISLDGYPERLKITLEKLSEEVKKWLLSSENGRILKEGIKTVIVGKPNVGKSSLLNVLAGEERAIVTEIAGTTRDVLEEQIYLNGITLNILDTAGIRFTEDIVEKIGVEKAKKHLKDADLILYVVDASVPLTEEDEMILHMLTGKRAVVVLNKSDLAAVVTESELRERLSNPMVSVSAKEGQGLEELEHVIETLFFQGELSFNDEIYVTNLRQKKNLEEAGGAIQMVIKSIEDQMPEDFFTIDLMSAYASLGKILGEEAEEDLVNEIFRKFCVGK